MPIKKHYILMLVIAIFFVSFKSKDVQSGIGICPCGTLVTYATNVLHPQTEAYITQGFTAFQGWMTSELFENNILPDYKAMTAQFATVVKQQEAQLGKMYDAKHEKDVARTIATAKAKSQAEFTTSEQLCKTATQSRSLLASKDNASLTSASVVSHVTQRASLGNQMLSAGENNDTLSRFEHYRANFVNPGDNGNGMGAVATSAAPAHMRNCDIDYHSLVASKKTMDIDFSDGTVTDDENCLMANTANVFATTPMAIPEAFMVDGNGNVRPEAAAVISKQLQLDFCLNVFSTAYMQPIAKKTKGAPEVAENFHAAAAEQGLDRATSEELNGDRPSLEAQEEMLTSVSADPNAQISLSGEGPANAGRLELSAQARKNAKLFDTLQSTMMDEMVTMCRLSLQLERDKSELANQVNNLRQSGTTL